MEFGDLSRASVSDILGEDILLNIEEAFCRISGMSAVIVDADGRMISNSYRMDAFCSQYTWARKKEQRKCELCFRYSLQNAFRKGRSEPYECHSGLLECAIPITVGNHLLCGFVIGQVLTERPKEEKARQLALEQGMDFEAYWDALCRVKVVEEKRFRNAYTFLRTIGDILSEIALGKYQAIETGKEIERVANMKSDFLANMSHEIRTPMNAVIGMAEMALREDVPPAARDYLIQIKSSGKALLNIINDILDFSKIESGKMTLNPEEYEPLSLLNDVANIIQTRVTDKNVDILLHIEPGLPKRLYGDSLRIRQILINLANNAVKFTNRGFVRLRINYWKLSDEEIEIFFAVEDTGIGIKKEDMPKLFRSFQQLDSKRNRNIEGTGLGLAITKQLVDLMKGEVSVESVYEEGSTFSFKIPQKVVDWEPSIVIHKPAGMVAIGYFGNQSNAKEFFDDTNKLGVYSVALIASEMFDKVCSLYQQEFFGKKLYIFTDRESYDDSIHDILEKNSEITGVLLVNSDGNNKESDLPNLRIIRKPISTLSIANALNGEEMHYSEVNDDSFEFTAPDARILIVDDNAINLTIARGLLEPLNMQIDTAESGKEALEKIRDVHYDIIFMDHMMPELDGVETTRIIRRLHPSCNDIPIIALTANVMAEAKDSFLQEGMNDFVPKPIEVRVIVDMVKKWLPKEKIQRVAVPTANEKKEAQKEEVSFEIADLETDVARKLLGNDDLFWTVLKEYYKNIPGKIKKIRDSYENEDWAAYTIDVHALKSSSRQIGAMTLAGMAEKLEKAGNQRDLEFIRNSTGVMLEKYESYLTELRSFCEEEKTETAEKKKADKETISDLLTQMSAAVDELDSDTMEEVFRELDSFAYEKAQEKLLEHLREAVDNIAVDTCAEIIKQWINIL